jgi:hypothetical protein
VSEEYERPIAVYPENPEPVDARKREYVKRMIAAGLTFSEYYLASVEELAREVGLTK